MNFAYALTLKGKTVDFMYKDKARTVLVQEIKACNNGKQIIKGIEMGEFNAALNDPNCEVGSETDFTRSFRINEMSFVTVR